MFACLCACMSGLIPVCISECPRACLCQACFLLPVRMSACLPMSGLFLIACTPVWPSQDWVLFAYLHVRMACVIVCWSFCLTFVSFPFLYLFMLTTCYRQKYKRRTVIKNFVFDTLTWLFALWHEMDGGQKYDGIQRGPRGLAVFLVSLIAFSQKFPCLHSWHQNRNLYQAKKTVKCKTVYICLPWCCRIWRRPSVWEKQTRQTDAWSSHQGRHCTKI